MVQSTKPHRNHAPLSLSSPGYFSVWFLLVPLCQLLRLCFLVVTRSRCHSVTANRSRLNMPPTSTKILLPHAPAQHPRLYSFIISMQRALSKLSPLDAPFLASFLAARLLVHDVSLWAPCEGPSSFVNSSSGCTVVHQPPT